MPHDISSPCLQGEVGRGFEARSAVFPDQGATPPQPSPAFAGEGAASGARAMTRARNGWVLPVSLLLALLLGLVPLPAILQPLRPYWLALVLAYWVLEEPDKVGLGVAFLLGLLADLVFGGLLGEQAMRLAILAFILDRFRARLRFFPLSQQALAIGGLLLNDRVVSAAIHLVLGEPGSCSPAFMNSAERGTPVFMRSSISWTQSGS